MRHELTFEWIGGNTCLNDHGIKTLKENGIPFYYDSCFRLCALLDGNKYAPIEYYKISGDIWGIVEKPQRTAERFGIPPEEAARAVGHGYTKEDCLCLDLNPDAAPFTWSLFDAVEKADCYRRKGYEYVEILQSVADNNLYYVVAT